MNDYESYVGFRPTSLCKPLPLYEDPSYDMSKDDVDLGMPYPKKTIMVLVLAGGVTNRFGTKHLAEMNSPFTGVNYNTNPPTLPNKDDHNVPYGVIPN